MASRLSRLVRVAALATSALALTLVAAPASAEVPKADGPLWLFPENPFAWVEDEPNMSLPEISTEDLGVYACAPVAPSSMDLRKCCLGTKGAPLNADSLGNYFCYCVPQKIASVCGTVGGQGMGAPIKENADWCIFTSTHPYWPSAKRSCIK